jgi:hypothetical protein
MTGEVYMETQGGLAGKMRDLAGSAKDMVRAAVKEAMAWDFYKWTVLALMTATFLLVALSYGGIRAELAQLKQQGGTTGGAASTTDIDKQMADMKASLMQAMTDMKTDLNSDLAKISSKLDARNQAKPAVAPAPKPVVKPKPQ